MSLQEPVSSGTTDQPASGNGSGNVAVKNADSDFVSKLSQIYKKLKFSKNLKKAMKDVEQDMLNMLDCKLFTIYQSVDNGKEIVASYKGGIVLTRTTISSSRFLSVPHPLPAMWRSASAPSLWKMSTMPNS